MSAKITLAMSTPKKITIIDFGGLKETPIDTKQKNCIKPTTSQP